ncbi:MAG: RNA-binding domain-containing protein [Anaerolineae bacterium]
MKGQWYRADLHLHTPASEDYAEPGVTFLEFLQKAESKGLDIIAITDHNTVAGYRALLQEVEELSLLERLQRLRADEKRRLEEYRRLMKKILILPGFEFTTTFGFHVLGIFSERTSVRELEHVLMELNVPVDLLDRGATEVGATTDPLTAYRIIAQHGGLVIAAHANSTHGVAMRKFPLGGQTKIAWTQDPNLHALEVTDLESTGRFTTASFFSGSKPEYPRRMHCIQGSDAHRLTRDPKDKKLLGVGDRVTEIFLEERTFEALKAVFLGQDFALTRPYRPTREAFDHVQAAREQGPSIVQAFHESMSKQGGRLHKIVCDVAAFANGHGGTIYVGVGANPSRPPIGVDDPDAAVATLKAELQKKITPPLEVSIDVLESQGRNVIRITVPEGPDKPYAVDGSLIYVRQEAETSIAVRDEIVQLVRDALTRASREEAKEEAGLPEEPSKPPEAVRPLEGLPVPPPKTGVEIVETVERKGVLYHTLRDLRNGHLVKNVTRSSARRLWRYAITQHETNPVDESKIKWRANIGLLRSHTRGGKRRYDFVQQDTAGNLHVYYGVTEEGIGGEWAQFLEENPSSEEEA